MKVWRGRRRSLWRQGSSGSKAIGRLRGTTESLWLGKTYNWLHLITKNGHVLIPKIRVNSWLWNGGSKLSASWPPATSGAAPRSRPTGMSPIYRSARIRSCGLTCRLRCRMVQLGPVHFWIGWILGREDIPTISLDIQIFGKHAFKNEHVRFFASRTVDFLHGFQWMSSVYIDR